MKLYQIVDSNSDNAGLVATDAPTDTLFELWTEIDSTEDDHDEEPIDRFVEALREQGHNAERVYVEDTIYP